MQRVWNKSFAKLIDEQHCRTSNEAEWELMAHAATAIANKVAKVAAQCTQSIGILCLVGSGNNGGDAALAVTLEALRPFPICILCFGHVHGKITKGCSRALAAVRKLRPDVTIIPYTENFISESTTNFANIILIDGIYGLGFRAPARNMDFLTAVRDIKSLTKAKIIAVDIPSGMEADCFEYGSDEGFIPADYTVTFGGVKPVHVFSPGRDHCGEVVVADIGFSVAAISEAESTEPKYVIEYCKEDIIGNPWSDLPASAHKFDRGHILVIGGSAGKLGAPIMSALAALRSGAGWVSVALPENAANHPEQLPLELTFEPFFADGRLSIEALEDFVLTRRVSSIVIGPGTMDSPITDVVLKKLIQFSNQDIHIVVDAGALQNILPALQREKEKPQASHFTLTPHPGEWLKMGQTALFSYGDLLDTAKELSELKISAVYKSATPTVFSDGNVSVSRFLNNQFAKAGTGDTLAGIIAALAKVIPDPHLRVHTALHHLRQAFDIACTTRDAESILPTDLIQNLGLIHTHHERT